MMIGRFRAPSGGFIPPGAAFDDTSCIRYRPTPGTIQNARGRAHSLVMRVDAAAIGHDGRRRGEPAGRPWRSIHGRTASAVSRCLARVVRMHRRVQPAAPTATLSLRSPGHAPRRLLAAFPPCARPCRAVRPLPRQPHARRLRQPRVPRAGAHQRGRPIIAQAVVPVVDGDDEASLAARVLVQEHRLYPLAVRWFVEGRLSLDGACVRVRGEQGTTQALLAPDLS